MKKCLSVLLVTLLLISCIPLSASAACGIAGHRVTEPTCTEDGVCRDCGVIYAALGHRYNENGICDYCGEKQEIAPDEPAAPDEPVEPDVCEHQWEIGLMREPTCVEDGLWEYYCTLCYERQVEVRPATGEHLYDEYGYCEYCGEQENPEECRHEWVDGVVTEPNCSNEGVWERYCTLCYRREVEFYPPNGQHVYDYDCDEECNYCGEMRQAPAEHTYSNPCDGDCDVCGYWRGYQEHQYSNGCDTDCNLCGYTRWVSGHWYDHQCDTVCNECGFVREPEGDHEYDLNCDNTCNICGHERAGYDHVYSDTYDANCNICGAWRAVPQGNIIYNQPEDKVSENEHYTTFYIEYTGSYYCYWYLVRSGGSAKEVAQGWRLDIDVTRDLNGAYVYCLLKDGPSGDTVARSRNATIHLHVFDNGCDDSCNQCQYLREKRDHSYDSNCDVDCNECGFLREASHDYWGDCDNECHTCGLIREAPHMYYDVCQEECSWCDHRRENAAPHTYDYSCSEYCNVCGEWRDAGNLHVYDNVCDGSCNVCGYWRDVEGHWYDNDCDAECNRCGEIRQARYHWYDNDCDPDCNTCGALRDVAGHRYDDEDDRYCNICGAYRDDEPDIPDISCLHEHAIAATCVRVGYCKDCGQRTEPLGHEYDDDADTECNVCYSTRDLENPCEHECSEPWCYGGNVNGLHLVVYDCMLCYQTVFMDVELCYGGTATCGAPAECERCYLNYGDTTGDHQYDDENDQECNVCGEWREVEPDVPVVPDQPCTHEHGRQPTCTEEGYCFDCGLMFAPLGHLFNEMGICEYCGEKQDIIPDVPVVPDVCEHEWEETLLREPTCSEDGLWEYNCLLCGERRQEFTPATGEHDYDENGYCIYCGQQQITEPEECHHEWQELMFTEPTCVNEGVWERYCPLCGRREVEFFPATGVHIYDDDTDPECNYCGERREVEPEECDHQWIVHIVSEPTCIHEGVSEHRCVLCGECYQEFTPATGEHVYDDEDDAECNYCGEWREVKPDVPVVPDLPCTHEHGRQPTCTEEGYCSDCGLMFAPLGHLFNEMGICEYCGEKKEIEPDLPDVPVVPDVCEHEYEYECAQVCALCGELTRPDAECVEYQWVEVRGDGVHVINYECRYCHEPLRGYAEECYGGAATCHKLAECVVCGREYGDYADHDYAAVVTAPDCESGGYTTYTCTVCGDSYVADRTAALGHDYTAVVTAPDCVNGGYTTYTCTVCGNSYVADRTEALGHDYTAATCTAPKTCKVCGVTSGSALGHDYAAAVTAPNCVSGGYTTYTCTVCGDSYVADRTEALGHDYNAVVTAPDCVSGGYTTYTCTACGDSYVGDRTAALGHDYTAATCTAPKTCKVCGVTSGSALGHDYAAVVTAPDCVSGGYTTYTCTVCGDSYVADQTAALGHDYNAVVTAPDCVNGGYTTYTCTVCGDSYVADQIAARGHDYNAATCTAPKTCKNCGATSGSALGHDYAAVVTAPDCVNGGYTTYTCTACGDSYVGDQTEALGHDYTAAVTAPDCVSGGYTTYTCTACGDSYVGDRTEPLGHDYAAATCTAPKTCKNCGATSGKKLGHTYSNDCDKSCNRCKATRTVGDHVWVNGACDLCGIASPSQVTITSESATDSYAKMGAKVSAKVTAEGDGLTYTWYIKNEGGSKYSKSSVTSATYSTTMSDKAKNRRVYCVVTDKYGNKVQSKTFILRESVSITKEPATAAYAKKGAKVSVKITASGDGLKYAWYIKNDGASKYSKSSVTSSTYSVTMSSKVKGRKVYCIVTDKYGKKVQSKTFVLRESVSIVTQPKTVTVAKNKTAKVTVKASGDGLKYTWYIKNDGAKKYSKSSITKSSYSVTMTSKVKNRLVYCVVTDKYGKTVKSTTVRLKMK